MYSTLVCLVCMCEKVGSHEFSSCDSMVWMYEDHMQAENKRS